MDQALRGAGWILSAVLFGAVGTYVISGISTYTNSASSSTPIVIRDQIRANEHHLSGMMIVNATCDVLSVSYKKISQSNYELVFTTWPEPSVPCTKEPTPRVFDTVVFAPSVGVLFTATLDKQPLQIAVYPTYTE